MRSHITPSKIVASVIFIFLSAFVWIKMCSFKEHKRYGYVLDKRPTSYVQENEYNFVLIEYDDGDVGIEKMQTKKWDKLKRGDMLCFEQTPNDLDAWDMVLIAFSIGCMVHMGSVIVKIPKS